MFCRLVYISELQESSLLSMESGEPAVTQSAMMATVAMKLSSWLQCAVRAVLWHRIMVIISTAGACCCQNWSLIIWYLLLNVYLLRNSTLHDIKVRCKVVSHLVSFHCLAKVSELRLYGYVLLSGKLLVVVFVVCTVAACSFQTHSCSEQTAECSTPTYISARFC